MDATRYLALFETESREHLADCNRALLAWEQDPRAVEPVQGLFRSVHSLKGMAAALGFERLAGLSHAFEQLLSRVRDGTVLPGDTLFATAFEVVDALERGAVLAVEGRDGSLLTTPLVEALQRAGAGQAVAASPAVGAPAPEASGIARGPRIVVRLRAGLPLPGARALLLIRQAEQVAPVVELDPPAEQILAPGFAGEFSFALPPGQDPGPVAEALRTAGGQDVEVVRTSAGAARRSRQVRVDLNRLTRLIQLTGELVATRNALGALPGLRQNPDLLAGFHRLDRQLDELRDQVLATRMAPVAEVFDRLPRPVRDLAARLGKRVRLDFAGTDIELDRAILDELHDPLLHLVRNALDHGIESPEVREAAGKPPVGVIAVVARRERAAVRIEVRDDGAGVDEARVRAGADPGLSLVDLLCRPGFTTAEAVSDVSGRGVGMDAVATWVRTRGGSLGLRTVHGEGTTIGLQLPLSVAIIPALLVGAGEERYAVPVSFVAETTRVRGDGDEAADLAGHPLPVRRLLPLDAAPNGDRWRPGLVLEVRGRREILLVDRLLGQEEIVVGPLDAPRGTARWVAGATILSDGRPALILDPGAMVQET